ncbi:23S rRNA pseudouridine2605 synthase [Steroidobacter denitrificans]|uniref:23S rRNA pseudouridine2605 synthase n=1 Tax=Steroidobacter denitrificans TaxID=465721 RepID=A0A127FB77_STEDE|nr:S4 domain-containing protein [Steroidobacter denitrificans]AMN46858.1 23S rRNA pseudouridine2605 synthase [Steroidobacter denitrificans]
MSERLHKVLAQHGLGSRREIEKWMLEGRILLNGKAALPGEHYRSGDRVMLDGRDVTAHLQTSKGPQVLIYHKPQGQHISVRGPDETPHESESSQDHAAIAGARASVLESLPAIRGGRWLVINAMQTGDSGLLLLTRDGRLADALRRRAATTPTTYVARVLVPAPDFDLATLPRTVNYDGEMLEFETIEAAGGEGTNRWFRIESPHAHRRAAVRALFESRGLAVSRVIQLRFAGLELPRDLPRGRHRAVSEQEVAALYAHAGLAMPQEQKTTANFAATHSRRRPPPDRRKPKRPGSRSMRKHAQQAGAAVPESGAPEAGTGRRPASRPHTQARPRAQERSPARAGMPPSARGRRRGKATGTRKSRR